MSEHDRHKKPKPKKHVTDQDIEFVEEAIHSVSEHEHTHPNFRFEQDVVDVVRGLVLSTESMKDTMESMKSTMVSMQHTMTSLSAVIDGKNFGDRTDGLAFRVGSLERTRKWNLLILRSAYLMLLGIFARTSWLTLKGFIPVTFQVIDKLMGVSNGHS